MAGAKLTISSRNYSSWSLRAWLFCQLAELDAVVAVKSVPVQMATPAVAAVRRTTRVTQAEAEAEAATA